MDLRARYPEPCTSLLGEGHRIYPYLLRGRVIDRPNQLWATYVTYIPMACGFMCLVAILDWRCPPCAGLDSGFYIFNSDQGCQFTSRAFTEVLEAHDVRISMDGKGCYRDNIFVEWLCHSMNYVGFDLNAFENGSHMREDLKGYFTWFNKDRPH
ncbi:hypothetical protein [Halomonas stenophila]|uniref:Putative transposase n=1 Tax=Halomonas stenophila TaxID=795312 RepID=A0A7W5HM45_9GAMM|nr:hypothetical protein [Halomonas stenophila]MBB3231924.1 putative transposase [Halomonas stenophila]